MTMNQKIHIRTYGCQMNVKDSERIMGLLAEQGCVPAGEAEDADVIIMNTCAVREKPELKLTAALGRLKPIKLRNPKTVIAVGGCVAQRLGQELPRTG